MRKFEPWAMLCCCVIAFAANAHSQLWPKAGLWEVTSQTSTGGCYVQMPNGAKAYPGPTTNCEEMARMTGGTVVRGDGDTTAGASPNAPITAQVCVTQAMIDKYGSQSSNSPRDGCHMSDVVTTPSGMTAKMVCAGRMNATGTVQTTFVDANTVKSTLHMTVTMPMGSANQTFDTFDTMVRSTSVYKGTDCGSVKPLAMPAGQ